MLRAISVLAVSCAFLAWGGDVHAQSGKGVTGRELLDIVEAVYPGAELKDDSAGDPMIVASAPVQDFIILTQGCDDERRCEVIRIMTGWQGPYGADTIARINGFHRGHLFGRAFLDEENDLALEWNVTAAGASADYLRTHVETWGGGVVPVFLREVVYRGRELESSERAGGVRPVSLQRDRLAKKAADGVYKTLRMPGQAGRD